jgi:hypothetical protein
MATKIVTKNSSTASAVPTASDLVQGELAVNVADKKLFTEDNSGAIIELADGVKLAGIEASADVTDTANVTAAGALMDSELTSEASVKALNQGVATTDSPAFAGLTVDTTTLAVDSTNNRVGIGTSSPDANLVVYETATSGTDHFAQRWRTQSGGVLSIACSDLSLANPTWQIRSGSSEPIAFNQASNERMRIDSSGKVGIGTTSPARTLHSKGGSGISTTGKFEAGGSQVYVQLSSSGQADGDSGYIGYDSSKNLTLFTDNTERMRIDSSGNVQQGNYSDTTVKNFSMRSTKALFDIVVDGATNAAGTTLTYSWANGGQGPLKFSDASGERMRIDSSGNLLVGQTAQNYNVVGASLGSDGILRTCVDNGTVAAFNRRSSDGAIVGFYKDGVTVGSISTNANSLPSDRNFKRNIQDLTLGLDFVESLNPVTYNFKIDDEGQAVMTGLIAQEVEEALTAAGVEKNSMTLLQHKPTEDVKESDYQMDYLKLVPILINSIKEQQTLIETLETRIAALEE